MFILPLGIGRFVCVILCPKFKVFNLNSLQNKFRFVVVKYFEILNTTNKRNGLIYYTFIFYYNFFIIILFENTMFL